MTLIAFAANERSADLLTDTASYSPVLRHMGHSSKVAPLAHIDSALLTQGDVAFAFAINFEIDMLTQRAPDLDALVPDAAAAARKIADATEFKTSGREAAFFLVGYSPATGRFVAYGFALESNFEPWPIDGLHVMPSPITMRPSDLELRRMEAAGVKLDDLHRLRAMPAAKVPGNASQWLNLGIRAREERFAIPANTRLKTAVAGHLVHTHLSRGKVSSKRIHTFDDSGPEFQKMIEGTYHPQAQLGPCWCESGKRTIDCHLAEHLTEACLCGSGETFGECCSVSEAAPNVRAWQMS